jgi:hypothetical protein
MNQISHAPSLLDPSPPHHHHFFSETSRFGQIVRDQQRGDGEIAAQIVEAFLQLGPRDCVQRSEWLVEQNYARPSGDATRQCYTLALATR